MTPPQSFKPLNWIDISAVAAKALIAYELKTRKRDLDTIDYEEKRFVQYLWTSNRSEGEWGTDVSIALEVDPRVDELEVESMAGKMPSYLRRAAVESAPQGRLLVLASDYQPWGNGCEIPVVLGTFDRTNLVGAARAAQQALESDLDGHFDQLIENEETGRYEISRARG